MNDSAPRVRRAMASVYVGQDDAPFLVTETPREVADLLRADPSGLIELTLGNSSEWNGKPLIVRADAVIAISPPKDQEGDDDE